MQTPNVVNIYAAAHPEGHFSSVSGIRLRTQSTENLNSDPNPNGHQSMTQHNGQVFNDAGWRVSEATVLGSRGVSREFAPETHVPT